MSAAPSEAGWRAAAEAALKGKSLESLTSRDADGSAIRPLYPRGEGPRAFRGAAVPRIVARMDNPDAAAASDQARADLDGGADALAVVFEGSTGAYGQGLSAADSATLHRAFNRLDFSGGLRLILDLAEPSQADAVVALIERLGADPRRLDVSFGLDPIGASARKGDFEADGSGDVARGVRAWRGQGFAGPFFAADARLVHAAGGTPVQELAYALASATAYLRALHANGETLEAARSAIAFRVTADADQFATIAKFRALRILWSAVESACGLEPRPARIEADTSWRTMTALDPYVNVMRGAVAAFAAGVGGADSICVVPFTQAVGLPDAFARRLARNAQTIMLKESHLGFVVDPAAGSGAFEALTADLCGKAWAQFQAIEAQGGLVAALRAGTLQAQVGEAAVKLRRDAAQLKTLATGVSAHPDLNEGPVETLGPFRSVPPAKAGALTPFRLMEPFEVLRHAAGSNAKVHLCVIGAPGPIARRIDFAREFFAIGGFEAIGGASASDAAADVRESAAAVVCICGSDEAYAEGVATYAAALKKAGAKAIFVAGRPGEHEQAWRAAGVDGFAFVGADALAALRSAHTLAGFGGKS